MTIQDHKEAAIRLKQFIITTRIELLDRRINRAFTPELKFTYQMKIAALKVNLFCLALDQLKRLD